jgi:hypothetical protein
MPAAYYDITIEEGSSYRLKLKFKDRNGNVVDLKNTVLAPDGFEDVLGSTNGIGVFAKMQVRNSVNAALVELNPISVTDSGPVGLFGESWKPVGSTAIDLTLSNGAAGSDGKVTPNIKISLSSFNTRRIDYGNYLYDLELVYFKKPTTGEPNFTAISEGLDKDTVVFRILQGRFIVTPAISR